MKLHLGCGYVHLPEDINVDIKALETVDVIADVRNLPFRKESASLIESYHVFEHIPRQQAKDCLKEWYRVLKKGGRLIIECPDFDQNCKDYLAAKTAEETLRSMSFIFGGDTIAAEDAHRWGYNFQLLGRMLSMIGFGKIYRTQPQAGYINIGACLRMEAEK